MNIKKGIIASLLVFALIFSATACRKLEDNEGYTLETNAYVTDENGEQKEVEVETKENGETEIFFIDDEGEKVTVAKKDVKVEKKVVTATNAAKTTKKAQVEYVTDKSGEKVTDKNGVKLTKKYREATTSVIEEIFGDDTAEKLVDEDATAPTLALGEGTIDEKDIKEVEVATNKDGTPQNAIINMFGGFSGSSGSGSGSSTAKTTAVASPDKGSSDSGSGSSGSSSDKLTVVMTVAQTSDEGTTTVPMTIARDGNNYYSKVEFPMEGKGTITMEFLSIDGVSYLIIPKIKSYAKISEDLEDTFVPDEVLNLDKHGTYVSSGVTTINGKEYNTETYDEDGTTITYFAQKGAKIPSRIEYKYGSGDTKDEMIIEISKYVYSASKTYFELPSGYINLEKFISDEGDVDSLFN